MVAVVAHHEQLARLDGEAQHALAGRRGHPDVAVVVDAVVVYVAVDVVLFQQDAVDLDRPVFKIDLDLLPLGRDHALDDGVLVGGHLDDDDVARFGRIAEAGDDELVAVVQRLAHRVAVHGDVAADEQEKNHHQRHRVAEGLDPVVNRSGQLRLVGRGGGQGGVFGIHMGASLSF